MTLEDLKAALVDAGIPERLYRIGKPAHDDDDVHCIVKGRREWFVYYYEHGGMMPLASFKSEADACQYMLKHLLEVVRRA